jgi:hypothetical protein
VVHRKEIPVRRISTPRHHLVIGATIAGLGIATPAWASVPDSNAAALAGIAAPAQGSSAASRAATVGVSYGGLTSQDFPVVIEVNSRRTQVVRADIAIRTSCTAGGFVITGDGYARLRIRRGKFSASFGPVTRRNPDGTTVDLEGTISGIFNSSRTKVSGIWAFKATEHDAVGAVTDTCDSRTVSWSAKQ